MKLLIIIRDIILGTLVGVGIAAIFYICMLDDDAEIKSGKKVILSGFGPN